MKSKKEQILDTSLSLFLEKGFDNTSISDILSQTKIARGTLYYHFVSKEAIMDTIIERASQGILDGVRQIADDSGLSVTEKLFALFAGMKMQNLSGGQQMVDYLNQPQNALFHEKSNRMIIETIAPLLAAIIQEGIDKKVFETAYPMEAAEIILILMGEFVDAGPANHTADRTQALIYTVERILGANPGSLNLLYSLAPGQDMV